MMCTYPWIGQLTKRFGIRGTSAGGATVAFLGTLPFLYLSSHYFNVAVLVGALFIRGVGIGAVSVPSISAAYAAVPKEQLPMATTSLNIVQRLGGPTLTTLCATSLGWQLAVHSPANVTSAFTISFALLCSLHAVLIVATMRLPLRLEKIQAPRARSQEVGARA